MTNLLLLAAVVGNLIPIVPNHALTPGEADPAVTQANIQSTICVSGYTATVRNVSESTKYKVRSEYGLTKTIGPLEIDHLIPLEVGGSNDIRNLWPENRARVPYSAWNKDRLERRIHSEVCNGNLTLIQGQAIFLGDWRDSFDKYFGIN